MLKKFGLMIAFALTLAYPKKPVVVSQGDPIPVCPPYCGHQLR